MRFHHQETSNRHSKRRWSLCYISFTRMVNFWIKKCVSDFQNLWKSEAIITGVFHDAFSWARCQSNTAHAQQISQTSWREQDPGTDQLTSCFEKACSPIVTSVATLLWRKPHNLPWKKQKIIKNARHTKCFKKIQNETWNIRYRHLHIKN